MAGSVAANGEYRLVGTPGTGLVGRGRPRAHGGRDSLVGTGGPHYAGPGVPLAAWQCIGHGHPGKGPGAPACHVSVEGESPGRALPGFRELVGSETV